MRLSERYIALSAFRCFGKAILLRGDRERVMSNQSQPLNLLRGYDCG